MKKVYISPGETIIKLETYRDLEAKAQAHDAFKLAYDELAVKQSSILYSPTRTPMETGWMECYSDLTRAILENSKRTVRETPTSKEWATPQDRLRTDTPPRDLEMDSLPF